MGRELDDLEKSIELLFAEADKLATHMGPIMCPAPECDPNDEAKDAHASQSSYVNRIISFRLRICAITDSIVDFRSRSQL